MADWTFFSNHAHVLFVISKHEVISAREISLKIGITERFVHKIIQDLEEGSYITVEKQGRTNYYRVKPKKKLRHPVEAHIKIGTLMDLVNEGQR